MRLFIDLLPFFVPGIAVLLVIFTPGNGGDLNNALLLRAMRERKRQESHNGIVAFLTRKKSLKRMPLGKKDRNVD